MDYKYRAFISYRHSERGRQMAVALESALKRYARPLFSSSISIFRDESEEIAAIDLPEFIRNALINSEYLIFLADKNSASSEWCQKELEIWCEDPKRIKNLIIVLIDDEISTIGREKIDWSRTTALPNILEKHIPSVPLYIDLRWARTGREGSLRDPKFVKTINGLKAKLLGLTPTAMGGEEYRITQREIRRRNWIAGVLFVMLVLAVGATWWAKEEQKIAEKRARVTYANDLAFKSQIALRDGDRTTAFRLAELAHLYVDDDNSQVTRALVDALYYNEKQTHHALPWVYNFEGHLKSLNCVCFSPNGQRLATCSSDKTVKIWDLESRKAVMTLLGHSNRVWSVCFSPDGWRIATGSADSTAKIWDIQTGKVVMTLEGHSKSVESVCFSPDGHLLATGSADSTAKIWDAETGKAIKTLKGHSGWVSCVYFSPDGRHLATGSSDHTAKIWLINTGKSVETLKGHSNWVRSVCFSRDGYRLATGSDDYTAKIWDVTSKKNTTLEGHFDGVSSVCFSPDGSRLATGSFDQTTKIWDLNSRTSITTLNSHSSSVWSVCFSPDGRLLATGSFDNDLKIWQLEREKATITPRGYSFDVRSECFTADGRYSAIAIPLNPTITIFDLRSNRTLITLNGHSKRVQGMCFSSDGRRLASGSDDNTARIWDVESGKTVINLKGHSNSVLSVCFSPDGHYLATGSRDYTARIWDVESGKTVMALLDGHSDVVFSVCFSPDGRRLVTGSEDKTVKIWDVESGKSIITLEAPSSVLRVYFSPDGRRLTTESSDTSKIWEITPQGCIEAVQEKRLATLTLPQLTAYGLEPLLDQLPDNEAKLIATREVWQIAAFADLYAEKLIKGLPRRADYERARRLYQACLDDRHIDDSYFQKKLADLERVWKEKGE